MISADPNYAKNRLYDSFQNNQAQQTPTQEKIVFHSRALVCADGASSRLARSLGVVHSEPTAVCSRSYVQKPHAFKWDGMLFYPSSLLPGCCAIVRHANGDLGYLTFINPAMGGQVIRSFSLCLCLLIPFWPGERGRSITSPPRVYQDRPLHFSGTRTFHLPRKNESSLY